MEHFNQSEIGDTDGNGYPEFLDGWGRPIFFLRWAPGCSTNHTTGGVRDGYSDIQSGDPVKDHDPFDPRGVDTNAYNLIPLIYSNGANPGDATHGINVVGPEYSFAGTNGNIFPDANFQKIGSLIGVTSFGGITNHHIEAR